MNRSSDSRSTPPYTTSGVSPIGGRYFDVVARGSSTEPTVTSADSRLLDAAQTLVTLQQTSGASSSGQQRRTSHQLVHVHKRGGDLYRDDLSGPVSLTVSGGHLRMPPPAPPTGGSVSTIQPMGPPPPPSNVTTRYVVLQAANPNQTSRASVLPDNVQNQSRIHQAHSDQGAMKPPSQPPPSRRGRGKRGGGAVPPMSPMSGTPPSPSPSGRGRGRGRGRGSKAGGAPSGHVAPASTVATSSLDCDDQDDAEMNDGEGLTSQAEEEEKRRRKNGTTFQVGNLAVRNDIFDELLNERKLELLLDPEVMAILEKHKSKPTNRTRTLSNSSNSYMG